MKTHKAEHEGVTVAHSSILDSPLGDAWQRNVSAASDNARLLQEEATRFLTRRFQDNANTVREMASCRSFPDLFALQQKWLTDMTRAYSAEWIRCSEMLTKSLRADSAGNANPPERRHRFQH